MSLTCYSCRFSFAAGYSALMCSRSMQRAPIDPCAAFCYEPGTDEEERKEDAA